MPQISVVVPIYNVRDYLAECLDSLLAQTLQDIEVICINDGSTDDSGQIAAAYAQKDPRFVLINQVNGGLSAARNTGIRTATAPYVCFLDSDDRFKPQACQRMFEAVERSGADVVVFGGEALPLEASYPWLEQALSPTTKYIDPVSPVILFTEPVKPFSWRLAARRDLLLTKNILFDEDTRYGEDQVFAFELFPQVQTVQLISDKLYQYRLNRESSMLTKMLEQKQKLLLSHIRIESVILKKWQALGILDSYMPEQLRWMAEFYLRDALTLEDDAWADVLAAASKLMRAYVSRDDITNAHLSGATTQLLLWCYDNHVTSSTQRLMLKARFVLEEQGKRGFVKAALRKIFKRS